MFDGEDFSESLTRAKFEELNMDLFRGTLKPVQKVLDDADMQKKDVDEIVLVGSSSSLSRSSSTARSQARVSTPMKLWPMEQLFRPESCLGKKTLVVSSCSMSTP